MLFYGMHKAGTSFLQKYLIHFCNLNNIPLYSTAIADDNLSSNEQAQKVYKAIQDGGEGCIFFRNSSIKHLSKMNFDRGVRLIRNPLSILASAYYSHLRTHTTKGWPRLEKQRALLQQCSKEDGMFMTMSFLLSPTFFPGTPGPLYSLQEWDYSQQKYHVYRMEDMVSAPSEFIKSALKANKLDPQKYRLVPERILSFEYQSGGRKVGEVDPNSHLRSGSPDSWKDELPESVKNYIKTEYANILRKFYPEALENEK